MSGKSNPAKQLKDLDAQGAQAALAEALEAEIETGDSEASDSGGENSEAGDSEKRVVAMNRDDDEPLGEGDEETVSDALDDFLDDEDNPFAAAAQFAEHVRMAEALLFAAVEPLDEATLASRLPDHARLDEILEVLQRQYENRGVTLRKTGKKWFFATAADVAHVLNAEQVQPRKLTRAALETLAIIAYHQPCTRAEIEEVRGVAVSKGSLDTLMEIGWIRLRGRKEDTPGRPLTYGTSQEFLEHFGLASISHLPGMADLKAAGLLDARLPPDFTVPSPRDSDGDEIETDENAPPEGEFVADFHEESAEPPADTEEADADEAEADEAEAEMTLGEGADDTGAEGAEEIDEDDAGR